ncbi:MAG: hypothetical protein KZQ95_01230 [Candidatus Thiodiazotropha sp. (ex Epidulcina cf. delphinae)]|nr:hypothetical protein [Candidatus Thiodiazotropha sp. (ex Epidulcina cf. delphinae)]
MKAGHNQIEVAKIVGIYNLTISNELRHNCGLKDYRPKQARQLATNHPRLKARSRITQEDWSPEQINLWLTVADTLLSAMSGYHSPGQAQCGARSNTRRDQGYECCGQAPTKIPIMN